MLTRSSSTWSEVVITRELAWKPRWARIRLVNSGGQVDVRHLQRAAHQVAAAALRRRRRAGRRRSWRLARNAVSPTFSRPIGLVKSARATWRDVALRLSSEKVPRDLAVGADGVRRQLDAGGHGGPASARRG